MQCERIVDESDSGGSKIGILEQIIWVDTYLNQSLLCKI